MQNFFIVIVTSTLISNQQWKAYLIFMCINFAFGPSCPSLLLLPEDGQLYPGRDRSAYAEPGVPARIMAARLQKTDHRDRLGRHGEQVYRR